MSTVKERIIGAVTVMNDNDAEKVWQLIQAAFSLTNVSETTPTADEAAIMKAYSNGDPDYQPSISHEDVMKELGL
jgi:hypothetical protein